MTTAISTNRMTVRLSSSRGKDQAPSTATQEPPTASRQSPRPGHRTRLVDLLRKYDYQVRNGRGRQLIQVHTIQKQSITVSDAFVFLPGPTLPEVFKLVSLLVGYITRDPELMGKPAALLQTDETWLPVRNIFRHMEKHGMLSSPDNWYAVANRVEEIPEALSVSSPKQLNDWGNLSSLGNSGSLPRAMAQQSSGSQPKIPDPDFHVGVFCSASNQQESYRSSAYRLGKELVQHNMGIVFGAGSSGMMGAMARGCLEQGGYLRGANISRIARVEGIPVGLQEFWGENIGIEDIYQRLMVMIANSDAFVVLPGGAGTLQELLALLMLLRDEGSPLMRQKQHPTKSKDILLVNHPIEDGSGGFYDPVLELLALFGFHAGREFQVVSNELEAVATLESRRKRVSETSRQRFWPSELGWANV